MDKKLLIDKEIKKIKFLMEYYHSGNLTEEEDENVDTNEEPTIGDEEPSIEDIDVEDNSEVEPEVEELPVEEPQMDNTSTETEIDVTKLISDMEAIKMENSKFSELLNQMVAKFGEINNKLDTQKDVESKIEDLKNDLMSDLESRIPTPIEKLELSSLNSFPYNIPLSKFWDSVSGYEAQPTKMNDLVDNTDNEIVEPKTYSLTPDEISKDYNQSTVRDSFRS